MYPARRAADVMLAGGVVAYPTEGVFGLGCLPDDAGAVLRILRIKQRDIAKGLILIAARKTEQLDGWVSPEHLAQIPAPVTGQPITWIVTPGDKVQAFVTGDNPGVAVRITTNPVARAMCDVC